MQDYNEMRQDMRATIDARRDLGPEYEAALVESFVERLDATIAARVRAEVHATGAAPYPGQPYPGQPYPGQPYPGQPYKKQKKSGNPSIPIALGSLGIGIPLTGIAAGEAGFAGLLLAWGGIVTINIAHAIGNWRHRD
ncbi:hypothetical protein HS041_30650 [Planomonospora sp. ID67723]|uniref:hypothetical protein n=1 Tax=Planomonospora sp. ID67723 TaxID=2738134 RepID=UPI0018C356BF|nr:hypothetical protein [Planomonospora sp. ID67723]MBG0832067.1 hypothetical protein [Planomonospora sp. ID67723]